MKKLILAVALLLAAPLALGQAQYQAGQTFQALANVTATNACGAAGSYVTLPVMQASVPKVFTWTVTFKTAAPGAQTTNLCGSIDAVNWFTLDSSTNLSYTSDTASGEMRHVTNKPVRFVGCALASYTAGGNAGVSCNVVATIQ